MNHASLFSGIGGFDLAAREVGWNNVFQCEIDPFCQSVLKYYFPKTVLYEDIKRTDFTSWKGKIDVLTGGFPCQPFSVAGQRKGADDNRYLWPEMLRVIRETRPLWVIGENVAGITNMVQPSSETDVETKSDQDEENYKETILEQEYIINTICDDLEREGYSVQPIIIPACGVGAPHRRDRVWFIASYRSDARIEGLRQERKNEIHEFESTSHSNGTRGLQFGERRDIRDKKQYDQDKEPERHEQPSRFGGSGEAYVICDSDSPRFQAKGTGQQTTGIAGSRLQGLITNAEGKQLENTLRAWRRITGSTNLYRKKDWRNFPTQSPICRGNDGLPFNVDNLTIPYGKWRKESIKAYGNAIVPLIAVKIFEMINKIERYEQQTTL